MALKHLRQYTEDSKSKFILSFLMISISLVMGCTQPTDNRPVILEIKGEPIYMDELDQLARVSLAQSNMKLETPEGQEKYKEIAPNLYNTLIDIYTLKLAAEDLDVQPDPAEVEKRFQVIKNNLTKQGVYQRYMAGLNLDEDKFKQALKEKISTEMISKKVFDEAQVNVTEQEIGDYYYQNREKFSHPNRVRASHIFIALPQDADEAAVEKAQQKAEQLRKMVGDTPQSTFVGLAQSYSEDPNTSARGGDLGFIQRNETNRFDEDFLDKVFSMKEGNVSDVFQSRVGFHIVWITDHEQSLEEATKEIQKHLTNKEKTEAFAKWMEEQRRTMDINRLFNPETFEVLGNEST